MKLLFVATVIILAMLIELLSGSIGLYLPLTALVAFYLYGSMSLEIGIFVALLAGIILDLVYGRTLILTPIILIVAIGAGWCLHRKRPELLLETIPSGIAVGIVVAVGASVMRLLNGLPHPFQRLPWEMVWLGGIGLLLFPLVIIILDPIAQQLGFPRFIKKSRSRWNQHSQGSSRLRAQESQD